MQQIFFRWWSGLASKNERAEGIEILFALSLGHVKSDGQLDQGSAAIKENISSHMLSAMLSKHVLMSYRGHCFIIDVQPIFPCVTISVGAKNIDSIVC
jgi:hypothetical protein